MRNVRSQLTKSLSSQVPVSILRRDLGKSVDQIEGIVVAVGRRWTVIASLVDHVHDGWVVIRVQDISEIRQPSTEKLSYVNRVLDGVGHPPAPAPNLRLPGNLPWRDELIHVLATDDLIGVYEERRYPDAVRIGVYTGTNRTECGLLQVTPVGQWHDSDTLIKLSKITRIEIGCRYQDALARYGDSRPRGLKRVTVKD